jgi:general secretion pathway protein J
MTMRTHTEAGFTLIELIVALSIAALLSTMLLGGYTFASRAWNRADAASDAADQIYGAQSVLRRAVRGISLDPAEVKFAGTAASVDFVSAFALPGEDPEPTAFSLGIDPCPEGHCLVLILSRPDWVKNGSGLVSTTILRGIEGASIAYRGPGDTDWQSDWPDNGSAPALVRIEVSFARRARMRWPTLYLAPPRAS